MNFFEHQDVARRQTRRLVIFFILAVVMIVVAMNTIVGIAISYERSGTFSPMASYTGPEDNLIYLIVTVATLMVILLGSLYRIFQLREGGRAVAEMVGARLVDPDTNNSLERRLLNVVEEMAIASGTPVPEVYVMDEEEGINAFAAGYQPATAIVAVTRGTLETLNRDELQGVIAHEFSHVMHGDMRLNIRLMGVLHGILVIAMIGYYMLRSSGRSRSGKKNGAGAVLAIGLGMMVVGYAGVFFGRLIKSAVSRQREFLADASAVQFTRNPNGIASALLKIRNGVSGSHIENAHAEELSHMYFGEGVKVMLSSLLATHPPLEERIHRIAPGIDIDSLELTDASLASSQNTSTTTVQTSGFASAAGINTVAAAGTVSSGHLAYAARIQQGLPDAVHHALKSDIGASAILYALVFEHDTAVRQLERDALAQCVNISQLAVVDQITPVVLGLEEKYRLPVLELALPRIRRMPEVEQKQLLENLRHLISIDAQVTLQEYMVFAMTARYVAAVHEKHGRHQHHSLRPVLKEIMILLGMLAYAGSQTDEQAQQAFTKGMQALSLPASTLPKLQQDDYQNLADAMTGLRRLKPGLTQKLIAACAETILADNKLTIKETELLRTVCMVLDVPMPPLMDFA